MYPFFDDLSFNEHRFRHFLLGAVETTAMNILDEQQDNYKGNLYILVKELFSLPIPFLRFEDKMISVVPSFRTAIKAHHYK